MQGSKKTLILQEIPEDGVKKLLSNKESLAACDVAVFVYDRLGCFDTLVLAYRGFSKVLIIPLNIFFIICFALGKNIWIKYSGSS